MIAFVLDHARMEPLNGPIDRESRFVEALVAQPLEARHDAPHAWDRQASLPGFFNLFADRRDHRVDEHGVRDLFRVGIARIARHPENHHPQWDADLRGGEPRPVQVRHGVAHVGDELTQLRRAERLHRPRFLEKPRIAHFQDFANHAATKASMIFRTWSTECFSTSSISCNATPRALAPRPAAWLTTTAIAA